MSLEGPKLVYARADEALAEDTLEKALHLARQIEELLADTRSMAGPDVAGPRGLSGASPSAHSTRMARAMAAGLVDELAALVRPARNVGVS